MRTGGLGGMGMGKRPATGDPRRVRGGQDKKSGGGTDGCQADAKGVPGRWKIPERTTLGIFVRKAEWVSAQSGPQHKRTGNESFLDTGNTRR